MKPNIVALVAALALAGAFSTSCSDGLSVIFPGSNAVTVELFNDTDFEVEPRIRFDSSSNWFASLLPSEELATGTLEPGQVLRLNVDCDKLGVVQSCSRGFAWDTGASGF